MSLDPFSVAFGFLAIVEIVLGALAMALGVRQARSPGDPGNAERRPLLALVAVTLVSVAVVSFPLYYLLLQSWVPRWPGIMCMEGVRRIGAGTLGAARFLPGLASSLDGTKLLLLFAAGAWAVLRRAPGLRAARWGAVAAVLLGLVACLDGAAAFAFVAIPKEEIHPQAGCCASAGRTTGREDGLRPAGPDGRADPRGGVALPFIAAGAALGAGAGVLRRRTGTGGAGVPSLGVFALLAAASLPLAGRFLVDTAAPLVLDLPFHHCAWCAFARAPETIVGAALHLAGVFGAGWALVARAAATGAAGSAEPGPERTLLGVAAFGFLGTAAMATAVVYGP